MGIEQKNEKVTVTLGSVGFSQGEKMLIFEPSCARKEIIENKILTQIKKSNVRVYYAIDALRRQFRAV